METNLFRIAQHIDTLATFSDRTGKGVTRFSYSPEDRKAKRYLHELFEQLELKVFTDAIGNIRARYEGQNPALAPLWIGSHIDSVKNGGKFDGVVGVVGAIEVVCVLCEQGIRPRRSIEAIVFVEEDGSNFFTTMMGSKVMTGKYDIEALKKLRNIKGETCYDLAKTAGLSPDNLDNCRIRKGDIHAMMELHIEQGMVLDHESLSIGVVEAVMGMKTLRVTLEGVPNHAGTTPMHLRNDPLVCAAKLICNIQKMVHAYANPETVATVGRILCNPNMPNVIAGSVEFTVDIRDIQPEGIDIIEAMIRNEAAAIGAREGVHIHIDLIASSPCVHFAPTLVNIIEDVVKKKNASYRRINSGAVHDAAMLAEVTDVGMIFIPSKDGKSHQPEEYTSFEQIKLGCDILLAATVQLAN